MVTTIQPWGWYFHRSPYLIFTPPARSERRFLLYGSERPCYVAPRSYRQRRLRYETSGLRQRRNLLLAWLRRDRRWVYQFATWEYLLPFQQKNQPSFSPYKTLNRDGVSKLSEGCWFLCVTRCAGAFSRLLVTHFSRQSPFLFKEHPTQWRVLFVKLPPQTAKGYSR